jgi:hypothetical protein
MEKEPRQSTIIKEIDKILREDESVVGIWSRLQVQEGQTSHILIAEMSDRAAKQISVSPGGETTETEGVIFPRRLKKGHLIRELVFVPNDGGKETLLQEDEF